MDEIESLELKISKFLRFGVLLSGVIMFVGWVLQLRWRGNPFYNYDTYDPISLVRLLEVYLRNENWGALISYFGLVVLISLPIIRVLLTAILFITQKERLLALIALIVLSGLVASVLLGIEL